MWTAPGGGVGMGDGVGTDGRTEGGREGGRDGGGEWTKHGEEDTHEQRGARIEQKQKSTLGLERFRTEKSSTLYLQCFL